MGIALNYWSGIVSNLQMKTSRLGFFYSALPSLILLVLFYSLAIHMHRSLGGWPSGIGEIGFSMSLLTHANVTWDFFVISLLSALFGVPAAIFASLVIRRYRLIPYFALYAFFFFLSWGVM